MKNIFSIILLLSNFSIFAQTNSRTEQLVLKLSAEKNTYMNPKSLDKLKAMLDDRVIFVHSNGRTETKDEMVKNIMDGVWILRNVVIHDANVRVFKNNFAVLIGKGTFNATNAGTDTSTEIYYSEVWSHGAKGWLLASRHSQKILPQ